MLLETQGRNPQSLDKRSRRVSAYTPSPIPHGNPHRHPPPTGHSRPCIPRRHKSMKCCLLRQHQRGNHRSCSLAISFTRWREGDWGRQKYPPRNAPTGFLTGVAAAVVVEFRRSGEVVNVRRPAAREMVRRVNDIVCVL
jgi:hypothetical protein